MSPCEGHSHRVFVSVACHPHMTQKADLWTNFFNALRRLNDWNVSFQLISWYFFRTDLIANTSRGMRGFLNVVLLFHYIVWRGNLVVQYYGWDTSWMNGVRFPGGSVMLFFLFPTGVPPSPLCSGYRWQDDQESSWLLVWIKNTWNYTSTSLYVFV